MRTLIALLRLARRRLIRGVLTLLGVTLVIYLLESTLPGGPIASLTFSASISPAQRARLAQLSGANDPWPVQYITWLIGNDWRWLDTDGDGVGDAYGQKIGFLR